MNIEIYEKIPQDARRIREAVFLDEQGFENEYDENDTIAKHIVIYDDNNKALGTCRVYFDKDIGCYHIGRIAVIKEYRGGGLGRLLVTEAEKIAKALGGADVFIGGQVRVKDFYIKLGYSPIGDEYIEENVAHIGLKKPI